MPFAPTLRLIALEPLSTRILTTAFSQVNYLISSPIYTYENSAVIIDFIYYVSFCRPLSGRPRFGRSPIKIENLRFFPPLSGRVLRLYVKFVLRALSRLIGMKVIIKITRLHYPYLNSVILGKYLLSNPGFRKTRNRTKRILNYSTVKSNPNLPSLQTGIKITRSGRLSGQSIIAKRTSLTHLTGNFSPTDPTTGNSSFTIHETIELSGINSLGKFSFIITIAQKLN